MILVMVVMMIIIMVLFRFVTITIIVRERERERVPLPCLCFARVCLFQFRCLPRPQQKSQAQMSSFFATNNVGTETKRSVCWAGAFGYSRGPRAPRAPRWCKNSDDLFSYEPPADSNGPSSLTSLWRREILSYESLLWTAPWTNGNNASTEHHKQSPSGDHAVAL